MSFQSSGFPLNIKKIFLCFFSFLFFHSFPHFSDQNKYPINQLQKACPTPRRGEDPSACDPQGQTDRSQTEDSDPSSEEKKPKESDCRPDREVRVELQGSELWRRFYEIGTEMIITKAGR